MRAACCWFTSWTLGRARKGTTLVELLMVLAILGLLMGLLFTAYFATVRDFRGPDHPTDAVLVDESALATRSDGAPLQVAAEPPKSAPPEFVPDQYLVRFREGIGDPAAAAQALAADYPGGKVLNVYAEGCNVFIPEVTPERLQTHGSVESVENEGICRIAADTIPTGVRRTSAALAQPRLVTVDPATIGLPNVQGSLNRAATPTTVVAVIDTGIDATHPDLNVTRSQGFGLPNGNDENGHGTHVAGTIGARVNNQGVVGVFPGVGLWSLRILDRNGNGNYGNLASALNFVRQNASQISACNLSLGGPYSRYVNDLVDACANAGVIMVVAAGNERQDAARSTPASAAKAVCVAAMADTDGRSGGRGRTSSQGADDAFATFSNYGTTVDVIAPGVNIVSTYPRNRYASMSGTSMASPHTAGVLALFAGSTVTQAGAPARKATGLELVALLLRYRGGEFIRGRYDSRTYPLLIGP